jgi:hypothetical protein
MSGDWTGADSPMVNDDDPIIQPEFPAILGELGKDPIRSVQSKRLNESRHFDKLAPDRFAEPRSVYMIYMKFDATGKFIVKQLSELDYPDNLVAAEGRLLRAATGNGATLGSNFRNIVWKRPYYLTFVIDNPGWKVYWGPTGREDPIRFLYRKAGSTDTYITKNYSFFDAKPVHSLGSGDAFRLINYHLNENGYPVPAGQPEDYCFQIYLESPFAISTNPHTHIVIIVDPDGQNQGPRT